MTKLSFEEIKNEIINTDKYQSLKDEAHHGMTRYKHSLNVAKLSYRMAKILKADYISTTRGALLHDYFNTSEYRGTKGLKTASVHPILALNNANRDFKLNDKEQNIIVSHMFPMGDNIPNCKEAWIVTTADKICALGECTIHKPKELLTLYFLFFINII